MIGILVSGCLVDCGDHFYNTGTGLHKWSYLWIADSSVPTLSPQWTCRK